MTKLFATEHPRTTDKDISSEAFWGNTFRERDETFAWLREHAPVSWHEPLEDPALPPQVHGEAGFWAVVRADDIQYVSMHPEIFSSQLGGIEFRPKRPGLVQPPTFIEMDAPLHTQHRRIMSAAFTPKAVARIEQSIRERSERIVGDVVGAGEIDFVEQVAANEESLRGQLAEAARVCPIEALRFGGATVGGPVRRRSWRRGADPARFAWASRNGVRIVGVPRGGDEPSECTRRWV